VFIFVILLYALFASLFSLQKMTLEYSEPFFFVGSRMLFAGLILFAYQFLRNRAALKIAPKHLGYFMILGLFAIYLTNIFEAWGLNNMPSAKACMIYSLSPFLSAVMAYWVLRETMSISKFLGLCIGFLGLIPIFMLKSQTELSTGQLWSMSFPEGALLLATLFSVSGWIALKKLVFEYQYSAITANAISMILGGVFALLHSYFSGETWAPIPVTQLEPFIYNTAIMCFISNIICYNLYGYLLKRYSATLMSFSGLVSPLFASLFGWIFLQEAITWHYIASLAIFAIGLTVFYRAELATQ
jgi:drug/metabolite transporter (DMT)-like permease